MNRRYYVTQYGGIWSLSKKGYLKLLTDGASNASWDLAAPQYEAREVKTVQKNAKPIKVTNFKPEHYAYELEYFLKTGEQTGFNAPNDARIFDE